MKIPKTENARRLFGGKAAIVANIACGTCETIDAEAEFDSVETVEAIATALREAGLDVQVLAADRDLPEKLLKEEIGFVFNIAEGIGGRDREAQIPAVLSLLGIPYSGSDALTMSVTLDKALCKRVAASYGIRTASGFLLSAGDEEHLPAMNYPVLVKPNAEGSGKGISEHCIAGDPDELCTMLRSLFSNYKQDMLVETFLPGREFTVGILGNGKDLTVFPPMEIVFEHPTQGPYSVYSFEIKKNYQRYVHYVCPANVSEESAEEMTEAARTIFHALGCRDFARVDFRMDENGVPYFLEINPLPGLAPGYSDYPMAAEAIGLSYDKLIARIAELALKRI